MKPSSSFIKLDKFVHNRRAFDCGEGELNHFLQQYAAAHRRRGTSITMVLPDREDESAICAWYTLTHVSMDKSTLPKELAKQLPSYPIPFTLLAQLAVHRDLQGQGIGETALIKALDYIYKANLLIPSWAVVADALNDSVQGFYEKLGFRATNYPGHRVRLFLPMTEVEGMLAQPNVLPFEQPNLVKEPIAAYIASKGAVFPQGSLTNQECIMTTELKSGNTDETEIADKYDEAYYLNMHNFTVSPEEYDRIVAICLEPPGPISEGMLDLIRAAKKWGFV